MDQKAKNRITQLQGRMAVASFIAGLVIACACLFVVPPPGEISTSALSIVSELLVLAGALLGVKVSVDAKLQRFFTQIREDERHPGRRPTFEGAEEDPVDEEAY